MEDSAVEAAEVVAEVAVAARSEAEAMPAEISLERPGTKSPVVIPTKALGLLPSLLHKPMPGSSSACEL